MTMSPQELQVQQKRELEGKQESTVPARAYVPTADIYETADALRVELEMPGVDKDNVDIHIEQGMLTVEGKLDFSQYQSLQPLYTEYNVGNYARSFRLSTKIDQTKIGAEMKDGVLSLTLPKIADAKPRTIKVK
jgi:HSP20 family molecular chaperone IbpA